MLLLLLFCFLPISSGEITYSTLVNAEASTMFPLTCNTNILPEQLNALRFNLLDTNCNSRSFIQIPNLDDQMMNFIHIDEWNNDTYILCRKNGDDWSCRDIYPPIFDWRAEILNATLACISPYNSSTCQIRLNLGLSHAARVSLDDDVITYYFLWLILFWLLTSIYIGLTYHYQKYIESKYSTFFYAFRILRYIPTLVLYVLMGTPLYHLTIWDEDLRWNLRFYQWIVWAFLLFGLDIVDYILIRKNKHSTLK